MMPISVSCEQCRRVILVRPYRAKTFRFCSRSCLAKAMLPAIQIPRLQAIRGKRAHNNGGLTKPCAQCGKPFALPPSRARSKQYCSQDCYSAAQSIGIKREYRRITVNGRRILEHRHVMETALGRQLLPREHVHHINRDTLDNRLQNLAILDIREHGRMSSSHRGQK